jgi:hypothetical protein
MEELLYAQSVGQLEAHGNYQVGTIGETLNTDEEC